MEKDMTAMAAKLTQDHMEQIADYLAEKFPVLRQRKGAPSSRDMEIEIRERIVRVEEELKNQRDLIREILVTMDKRFEQVDKRFEEIRSDMDKRFTMMMWFTGLALTIVTGFLTGAMVLIR